MTVMTLSGVSHSYEVVPSASALVTPAQPVIVFIHGWLLSRIYWRPLMHQLAPDCTCVAYDLRGFGESDSRANVGAADCQNEAYDLAAYARDLKELLETLQLSQVWLVGHSLGGSVALWAAHLFPERVRGVVCVNAGGGIYIDRAFTKFRQAGQNLVRWRPRWLEAMPALPWLFTRLMVDRPLDYRWGKQRLADFLRADQAAALHSLLASTTEAEVHQLPRLVSQLAQPVYFIAGEQDMVMEPRYVRHLASFHPTFREGHQCVVGLERCGHFAMLEQTSAVAAQLRQWILA